MENYKEKVLNVVPDAEVYHWVGWNKITSIYSNERREHLTLRQNCISEEILWKNAWLYIQQYILEKLES
jgi:hypothetical protein